MDGTSSRKFGNTVQQFVCEPLNLHLTLNGRSNGPTLHEVSVLSVCGGKNDEFTKTVLEWLCRAKVVSKIHLLLCGQSKCIDKQLCVQDETGLSGDAPAGDDHEHKQQRQRKQQQQQQSQQSQQQQSQQQQQQSPPPPRRMVGLAKVDSKRQTNLPSQVQWQVLRPQIVVVGLHHFTELWSVKNCSNELLFPKNDWGNKYETNHYYRQRNATNDDANDDSSGAGGHSSSGNGSSRYGESDNSHNNDDDDSREKETSDDECNLARRKRRATPLLVVEKSWRPTLYRTDIYRRAMLIDCLALVAQHRPKIAFFHNIFEPSKQSERRRKDHAAWSQLVDVLSAFGSECSYRVRPIGLELRDDQESDDDDDGSGNDAFPPRDTWCNAVFLERVDNGFECASRLHHEFVHYNDNADAVAAIASAMQWIFHDHEAPPRSPSGIAALQQAVAEQFTLDCAQLFATPIGTLKRRKQTRLQKRKSLTVPVPVDFPTAYVKALAYYSVAQVVAALE